MSNLWLRHNAVIVGIFVSLTMTSLQVHPATGEIEEIVVTATKREQSIQDVPIAVSAFAGEDLEARGVQDLYGLQEVSPSISVYSSNSTSNGGTIRIRGVGTTGNNPGLEAAVGTFIDGVYRSRAGLAFNDLVDIDRVEILRGPQGTLFGKNTSAGALQILTKKPEFEQAGSLALSAGDFDSIRVQASYTNAIVDDVLAFRIAANYNERDGYYEDNTNGDAYDGRDRWGLRGQLLWTPTDTIENRLIIDYAERDEDCCPARYEFMNRTVQGQSSTSRGALSNGLPPGQVVDMLIAELGRPPVIEDFAEDEYNVGVNFKPFEEVEDWGVQNELGWDINDNMSFTSITSYREYEVDRGQDIDFSGADIAEPQFTNETFENFSQEFHLSIATESVDFLVGAYLYTEDIKTNESIRLASQGHRYLATIQTGLIDMALGLPLGTFQTMPSATIGTVRGTALGSFDPITRTLVSDGTLRGNHAPGDGYRADFEQETEGWSVFTHNVWHITDKLDLTFGARYSNEKKEALTIINGVNPLGASSPRDLALQLSNNATNEDHCTGLAAVGALCNNASWEDDNKEKEWSGFISLSYALTDDFNIYGSYSRGYKAGGFNLDQQAIEVDVFGTFLATGGLPVFLGGSAGLPADIPQEIIDSPITDAEGRNGLTQFACGSLGGIVRQFPENIDCLQLDDDHSFDPEFVDAYEIGVKAVFLDGRLTTNLALFYSDFEDFQLNTFTGTGFLISNTDEMISRGAELESMWNVTDGVYFTLGVTYADARYGDDLNLSGVDQVSLYLDQNFAALEDWNDLESIEGRQITHAPYWQGSASLFIEKPIGDNLFGYSNINVGYRGAHNTGSDLKPQKDVEDEAIVNLQLGLRAYDDRWDVQLWARNLFDNDVKTLVFNSVFQSGSFSTFIGPPRMIGITLRTQL